MTHYHQCASTMSCFTYLKGTYNHIYLLLNLERKLIKIPKTNKNKTRANQSRHWGLGQSDFCFPITFSFSFFLDNLLSNNLRGYSTMTFILSNSIAFHCLWLYDSCITWVGYVTHLGSLPPHHFLFGSTMPYITFLKQTYLIHHHSIFFFFLYFHPSSLLQRVNSRRK